MSKQKKIEHARFTSFRLSALATLPLVLAMACGGGSDSQPPGDGGSNDTLPSNMADGGGEVMDPALGPLAITATSPENGAMGVNVASAVTIVFSKPMNTTTVTVTATPAFTPEAPLWNTEGTQLTLSMATPLAASTAYSVAVAGVSASGEALQGPTATFAFTTGAPDLTAPTIASTTPANAAQNVAVGSPIVVVFSKAMDVASLMLTAVPEAAFGEPTLSADNLTATFQPSEALTAETNYQLTVAGSDLAGNALSGTATFSFTTGIPADTVAPTVVANVPENAAMNAGSGLITISFSEPMREADTAAATTVAPGVVCAGGWLWNAEKTTLACNTTMAANTSYTVTVGTGAKDVAGNALAAPHVFTFKTAAVADTTPPTIVSTTPADDSTGADRNTNIVITFSEPMDATSPEQAFTIVSPAGNTWTSKWSNGGKTITFNPANDFAHNALVTFRMGAAAKDTSGNAMGVNKEFSFRVLKQGTVTITGSLDGYLASNLNTAYLDATSLYAGDFVGNAFRRSFLTFSLATVPATAKRITEAVMTLRGVGTIGTPYGAANQGNLLVEHVNYGPSLEKADFDVAKDGTFTAANAPFIGAKTVNITGGLVVCPMLLCANNGVAADLAARETLGNRSQFRIRFAKDSDGDGANDYMYFHSSRAATPANRPSLKVTYEYP